MKTDFQKHVYAGEMVLYWPSLGEDPIWTTVLSESFFDSSGENEVVFLSHRPGYFAVSHIATESFIGSMVPMSKSEIIEAFIRNDIEKGMI